MSKKFLGLTKKQRANLWRILFAIPTRTRYDRWGWWHLYALELDDSCWYVGITRFRSVQVRYQQHATGKGSKWTKLHRPIRIIYTRKLGHMLEKDATLIETATTLQFIERYGVDAVRGGRLVAVDPALHRRMVEREKARQKPLMRV
jgi:predicted GIY-YIG superfamily endonuclease